MTYFNTPYAQQAYQSTFAQPQPFNPYNPYGNIYQQPQQPINYQAPAPPRVDFQGAIVNSYDEVRAYPTPQDGTIMLLNKNGQKLYLKTIRDGIPMIETYDFFPSTTNVEEQSQPKENINIPETLGKLENMISVLANRMNNYEQTVNLGK